ncbi:SAM-dependent methyltransferase [bacterium]|nr:SAM-dependent methyltransferase [bacterium]
MGNGTLASINHVSDTALWVAYYRAQESEKPNGLFKDPFAKKLAGEKGRQISESMQGLARFTGWTLVVRTCIIDRFIEEAIASGVDTILNLGAGLDTRPYRMKLPTSLHWIEVDYPDLLDYKQSHLAGEKPVCQLEHVRQDLSDGPKRRELFQRVASQSKKTLVITEGVIPYLSEEQVTDLARDLHSHPSFAFWIAEYFAQDIYKYLNNPKRNDKMKNAPFRFLPADWWRFFRELGWEKQEVRYLTEESIRLGIAVPMPWWAKFFQPFLSATTKAKHGRMTGYCLFRQI